MTLSYRHRFGRYWLRLWPEAMTINSMAKGERCSRRKQRAFPRTVEPSDFLVLRVRQLVGCSNNFPYIYRNGNVNRQTEENEVPIWALWNSHSDRLWLLFGPCTCFIFTFDGYLFLPGLKCAGLRFSFCVSAFYLLFSHLWSTLTIPFCENFGLSHLKQTIAKQ